MQRSILSSSDRNPGQRAGCKTSGLRSAELAALPGPSSRPWVCRVTNGICWKQIHSWEKKRANKSLRLLVSAPGWLALPRPLPSLHPAFHTSLGEPPTFSCMSPERHRGCSGLSAPDSRAVAYARLRAVCAAQHALLCGRPASWLHALVALLGLGWLNRLLQVEAGERGGGQVGEKTAMLLSLGLVSTSLAKCVLF